MSAKSLSQESYIEAVSIGIVEKTSQLTKNIRPSANEQTNFLTLRSASVGLEPRS